MFLLSTKQKSHRSVKDVSTKAILIVRIRIYSRDTAAHQLSRAHVQGQARAPVTLSMTKSSINSVRVSLRTVFIRARSFQQTQALYFTNTRDSSKLVISVLTRSKRRRMAIQMM